MKITTQFNLVQHLYSLVLDVHCKCNNLRLGVRFCACLYIYVWNLLICRNIINHYRLAYDG